MLGKRLLQALPGSNGMAVLLRLIDITWKTGQLPKYWKTAVLIPLLKKNKPKSAPSSYRPISLTSCIGKLVERMINERLNWWLEHNNIITPCQAGFRSNYTTEDQLIRLTQKIKNGFCDVWTIIIIIIDTRHVVHIVQTLEASLQFNR